MRRVAGDPWVLGEAAAGAAVGAAAVGGRAEVSGGRIHLEVGVYGEELLAAILRTYAR